MISSSFKVCFETGKRVERLIGNFSSGVGEGNLIPSQFPLKELPKMFCRVMEDRSGITMEGGLAVAAAVGCLDGFSQDGGRKTSCGLDFCFFLGTVANSRNLMQ